MGLGRARRVRSPLLVLLLLAVSACGQGGTGGGGGTSPAPATPAGAPSQGMLPTDAPIATEPAGSTGGGGGGGTTGSVCDLVPVAGLEKVFGVSGITTTLFEGPPDTCQIAGGDGGQLGAVVLTPSGGRMVFDTLRQGADVIDIPGVGEAAFYSGETQLLLVLKGDSMLSVAVDPSLDDADRLEQLKALAALAASGM